MQTELTENLITMPNRIAGFHEAAAAVKTVDNRPAVQWLVDQWTMEKEMRGFCETWAQYLAARIVRV